VDLFSWSPEQWEMVLKGIPWYFLLIPWIGLTIAIAAKSVVLSKSEATEPPPAEQSVSVVREVTSGRDTIASGRDVTVDSSVRKTEVAQVNVYVDSKDFVAKSYPREVATTDGPKQVEVWILWRDASWRFASTTTFNQTRLNQFLEGSKYKAALANADALICLGLASSWADKARTTPVSSLPEIRIEEIERKTDARAFNLCKELSERSWKVGTKPQFLGVGLGYHVDNALSDEDDRRQRALVVLHVKNGGEPLTLKASKELLKAVLQDETIQEFEGNRYSKILNGRQVCWTEIHHGKFQASELTCN